MFLTTEVIITFDPVKEFDAICRFQQDNDMSEWQYSDCTVGISFKRKKTIKAYLQGWEEGREALRKEMWEDGRDRLD